MPPPPLRPEASQAFANGLLSGAHFQVAYATNDLPRAKALLADRYGIARFAPIAGPLPEGGEIQVEFAWAGGVMIELLTASGAGSDIYVESLPVDRFALRLHHLGYLVRETEAWESLRRTIERDGWTKRIDQEIPGFMHQIFVEAPELGHLLEYLRPEPAGMTFLFETVPNN